MRKLIAQLMKFGIVGVIAFVIDYGLMNLLLMMHMHNILATSISFFVSLIFNYLASMKFVFKHREDMARWMEITIFFTSSFIGWIINEVIVWISTSWMPHDSMYTMHTQYVIWTNIGKLVATAVVMVWNFVIRKWLLDDTHTNAMNRLRSGDHKLTEEELEAKREKSFSHRLGMWSIEHAPFGWK
ncbi:GtrA family protein [Bifidobacterium callimiconis]|uniref:GtrA family protein n=1 Tax=Bifidobacterium callimiconis TaxID=2306973 RepID=UPI0030B846EC